MKFQNLLNILYDKIFRNAKKFLITSELCSRRTRSFCIRSLFDAGIGKCMYSELRLIDANSNRAREGIRTAEDYLRFSLGEFRWSSKLKAIRRSITELVAKRYSATELAGHRMVASDPQRPEGEAQSPPVDGNASGVAHRGLKRAQEALRVLEEFFRAETPDISGDFARHRYSLYETEQWLLVGSKSFEILQGAKVYVLLTGALCKRGLEATAEAVLKAGVKLVQIREKETEGEEFLKQAQSLQRRCSQHGAVLICNDRPDIMLLAGATGAHVGQTDLPPVAVRKLIGELGIIGRSTHSLAQVDQALQEDVDYIAIGSMYETSTKKSLTLTGLELARQVAARNLPLPVFAIGGISLERLPDIKACGISRVAISSAIISADDPEYEARKFIEIMAK